MSETTIFKIAAAAAVCVGLLVLMLVPVMRARTGTSPLAIGTGAPSVAPSSAVPPTEVPSASSSAANPTVAITTNSPTDQQPPGAVSGLRLASNSLATFTIAWQPATDNVSVGGYRIVVNGVQEALVTDTFVTLAWPRRPGNVLVQVSAIDLTGNTGEWRAISIIPPQPPRPTDTPPPTGTTNTTSAPFTRQWPTHTASMITAGTQSVSASPSQTATASATVSCVPSAPASASAAPSATGTPTMSTTPSGTPSGTPSSTPTAPTC